MSGHLEIDIVTPLKNFIHGEKALEVRVPTIDGEIQILPGHTELLSILGPGVLAFTFDGRERKFSISYGFAEIKKDKVLILAETCEEPSDIDLNRAKLAQKKAQDSLSGALTPEDFKKYQFKVQRALVRQSIAE